jgi:hypothetical protein
MHCKSALRTTHPLAGFPFLSLAGRAPLMSDASIKISH